MLSRLPKIGAFTLLGVTPEFGENSTLRKLFEF